MAQGRALRRVVALFDNIENLVTENDRRSDDEQRDQDTTLEYFFHFWVVNDINWRI